MTERNNAPGWQLLLQTSDTAFNQNLLSNFRDKTCGQTYRLDRTTSHCVLTFGLVCINRWSTDGLCSEIGIQICNVTVTGASKGSSPKKTPFLLHVPAVLTSTECEGRWTVAAVWIWWRRKIIQCTYRTYSPDHQVAIRNWVNCHPIILNTPQSAIPKHGKVFPAFIRQVMLIKSSWYFHSFNSLF